MQVSSVRGINARALIRFVFRLPAGLPRRNSSSCFPLPIALIGAMKRIVVCHLLLLLLLPLSACVWAEEGAAIAISQVPGASTARKETESQAILRKMMEDIRHCDKSIRYEYDPKTKKINPPELRKIKGIRLKKLLKNEIAIFKIDETYEGMHAVIVWMGQAGGAYSVSFHSVAFVDEFQPVRQRLEALWDVRFTDRLRPGPDVIIEGRYAEIEMLIDGKQRFLSIEKMPRDVYPHIGFTDVGCTHVAN